MTTADDADAARADAEATRPDTRMEGEESSDSATSPALEHLDDTIEAAKRAADQALAPQRDE